MASSLNDTEHALRGLSPEAEKRFVMIQSDSGCMTPLPSTDEVLSETSPVQTSKGLPKEPTKKTKKRKSADAEINSPRLRDLEEENAALKAKVEAFKSIVEKVNEDRATMKKELDKHKKHKTFDTETKKLKEELAALQTRLEAKEAEAFHLDECWKKESRKSRQKERELTLKIEILEKTLAELRVEISDIYSDNYKWHIQTETEKVESQKTIAALKEELEKYRANMPLLGQSPSLSARQVKKSDHGEPQRGSYAPPPF
jgi:chromosome segregation ATPase